jgi:hypothetical protein
VAYGGAEAAAEDTMGIMVITDPMEKEKQLWKYCVDGTPMAK